MRARLHHLILDCADPQALAQFYSALLSQPITYDSDDFVVIAAHDKSSGLAFQLAPDHRPPTWPDNAVEQQMHLDIMVEDVAEAAVQVLALGARKLDGEDVFADPAGHPFCLITRPTWADPLQLRFNHDVQLPEPLTERPLTIDDAAAVTAVMAASELTDLGEVMIEEADLISEWQRPSYDLSANAVGVVDAGQLVAYAEVAGGDRGDAAVHPDYRGRGIGTALARWMQDKARANGAAVIGMPVATGSAGEDLLQALGYQARWQSWLLRLGADRTIESQSLPAGYVIREAKPLEYRDVWTVTEDAFLEWAEREREPFDDFSAEVFTRPGFEPWHIRVAVDPADTVVGVAQLTVNGDCGYVAKLAVRAAHRDRGLARALLANAFELARAHGSVSCELATDSRTGALALYEKVGMAVVMTWVNYAIAL